jgi:hypothetical protein
MGAEEPLPYAPRRRDRSKYFAFRTELFLWHQEDRDIDRWFVGGDCAGWFFARLLPV